MACQLQLRSSRSVFSIIGLVSLAMKFCKKEALFRLFLSHAFLPLMYSFG